MLIKLVGIEIVKIFGLSFGRKINTIQKDLAKATVTLNLLKELERSPTENWVSSKAIMSSNLP